LNKPRKNYHYGCGTGPRGPEEILPVLGTNVNNHRSDHHQTLSLHCQWPIE